MWSITNLFAITTSLLAVTLEADRVVDYEHDGAMFGEEIDLQRAFHAHPAWRQALSLPQQLHLVAGVGGQTTGALVPAQYYRRRLATGSGAELKSSGWTNLVEWRTYTVNNFNWSHVAF